ncbi:MAG TPA: LacI family DNA-binding transcriptional regulator [Phenylobacterium sp.]
MADWDPSRRPTINDIARLAQVSKKTVSRVINQSPFVKADTRDRVAAIIAELGYAPDPQARGLAFRRSFLIGLVYDNPNPQYVIDMQQGILDAVRGSGFELLVHPCDRSSPTFVADVRAFVERQKLFGVVLPPSVSEDEQLIAALKEIDCDYVRIASVELDAGASMVVTHDQQGGYAAAKHLAQLGHTVVGHIHGPNTFRSAHERRAGFRQGLGEAHLRLPAEYVCEAAYTFDTGAAGAERLLKLRPRPTAIFTGNDEMAAGVYKAARDAGLEIPRDLSVVGYDDSPLAERLWPPLTTVRLPIREMGRSAALKLIGDSETKARAKPTEFEPALIVRESTAAAPR